MTFDRNAFNNVSSGGVNCAKLWSYKTTDTLATVAASDYFNEMRFALCENDMIFIVASDGLQMRNVTSLINASPVTTALWFGAGSIDTADIADEAVTTAKIADSNVTTAKIADSNVTTDKIADSNVTAAKLADAITPSHVVKYAAQVTTTGGSASEAFTVTGAAATDLAFVQVVNDGAGDVRVLQAAVTANTLTVTFTGDPAGDTVINYQLLRAIA